MRGRSLDPRGMFWKIRNGSDSRGADVKTSIFSPGRQGETSFKGRNREEATDRIHDYVEMDIFLEVVPNTGPS